jgi:hypothetical protein
MVVVAPLPGRFTLPTYTLRNGLGFIPLHIDFLGIYDPWLFEDSKQPLSC